MRKAVVLTVSVSVFIVILLAGAIYLLSKNDVENKFETIQANQALNIKQTGNYYVYFFNQDCGYCKDVEDKIDRKFTNNNLFLVDMKKSENKSFEYNWEEHRKKYDKVVGEVIDGNRKFFTGESEKKYKSPITDKQFGQVSYELVNGDKYVKFDSSANPEAIYAVDMTPRLNVSILNSSGLKIGGTPTLIEVKKGKIVKYMHGYEVNHFLEGENSSVKNQ
ncbi:hypothetical protein RV11_GL000965 [Enterococcus phoeniculicola]|uniref:Thioredoxin-like fold domain-containing protein n=1 Tax=Enterococcus phoeniculicola ATCC BAA-412 TaxID=1158610 RepID=R3WI81_9ENTE|nr:hypothetical protein [Enterococcus phoeniculicola]EOL41590.1 hypothetical protein UC3_03153 [Enterococcus phoeniculicola ATCC BAA-412]EOT78916.1 hypothetical protein I589_00423 [Enterococcus phoeniculicola ATCC BAA-412]OJG70718.1 hypothetical protein RV11_GL000965 [Enterococcus phoeniculicola]